METMAQNKPNLEIIADLESLAIRSVKFFAEHANKAINDKGCFYIAISGGHTPERFYQLLGHKEYLPDLEWDKVNLFWVDERYVPIDSPLSNFKLAQDTFISQVPIPMKNVHPIPTHLSDSSKSAKEYEKELREIFKLTDKQLPQFDLIMLGMGADGHTGSLFPNSYAPFDTEDLACVVYTLENEVTRITLTHPVLSNSKHLAVLVTGQEKAKTLMEVLTSEPDECKYPIHTLWPVLDKITWLVDSQAASMLK